MTTAKSLSLFDRVKCNVSSIKLVNCGLFVLYVIAALLPCIPLLNPEANFFKWDWISHQWAIGYFGEYLRSNLTFPAVLTSTLNVGVPNPIFYGYLFYPLLGSVATGVQAGISIRLFVALLFLLQFFWTKWALEQILSKERASNERDCTLIIFTICCLVNWTIYPLTNLYSRSALPEFFAVGSLTCAILAWACYVYSDRSEEKRPLFVWSFLLFAMLAAGYHAITALFSILVLGLLVVVGHHRFDRSGYRSLLKSAWLPAVLTLIALLPLLYVIINYSFRTGIGLANRIITFPNDIDWWFNRFYPLALDPRMFAEIRSGIGEAFVSYLDAQINMPMLMLWLGLAVMAVTNGQHRIGVRRGLVPLGVPVLAFVFFSALSLSHEIYDYLPSFFQRVQFAYRFTAYQNLCLLLGVIVLLSSIGSATVASDRRIRTLCFVCLTLSAAGLATKLEHAFFARNLDNSSRIVPTSDQRKALIVQPREYYGMYDYLIPGLYPDLDGSESAGSTQKFFSVLSSGQFGGVEPMIVEYPTTTWIRTQVMGFPWNRLLLDGQMVDVRDMRLWSATTARPPHAVAIKVPAGRHELRYAFTPDAIWSVLRLSSAAALMVFALGYAFQYFGGRFDKVSRNTDTTLRFRRKAWTPRIR
jgi:hypothetical protein